MNETVQENTFTTLAQEPRWAYSTMLPGPHRASGLRKQFGIPESSAILVTILVFI